MKTKIVFALIISSLILLTACSAARTFADGQYVLKVGESISNAAGSVKIRFVEVLEDSRCPADATCIWAGQAKVLVEVKNGTVAQQYTLTLDTLLEGDVNSIDIESYTITLVQVDPYPLASQPIDFADYSITLDIAQE